MHGEVVEYYALIRTFIYGCSPELRQAQDIDAASHDPEKIAAPSTYQLVALADDVNTNKDSSDFKVSLCLAQFSPRFTARFTARFSPSQFAALHWPFCVSISYIGVIYSRAIAAIRENFFAGLQQS